MSNDIEITQSRQRIPVTNYTPEFLQKLHDLDEDSTYDKLRWSLHDLIDSAARVLGDTAHESFTITIKVEGVPKCPPGQEFLT